MSRPYTREDNFECRVKAIFKKLRRQHKDEETNQKFSEWIECNRKDVGIAFLDDVESYMGLPFEEGEE